MSERPLAASAPIFLAGVLVFASPLSEWLSRFALPWYAVFPPWALLIALVALEEHGGGRRARGTTRTERDAVPGVEVDETERRR